MVASTQPDSQISGQIITYSTLDRLSAHHGICDSLPGNLSTKEFVNLHFLVLILFVIFKKPSHEQSTLSAKLQLCSSASAGYPPKPQTNLVIVLHMPYTHWAMQLLSKCAASCAACLHDIRQQDKPLRQCTWHALPFDFCKSVLWQLINVVIVSELWIICVHCYDLVILLTLVYHWHDTNRFGP